MDQASIPSSIVTSSTQPLDMQISNHSQRCPLESFLRSKKLKMSRGKTSIKRIPSLSPEDIKIGSRLGKGAFTKVHALSSISKSARKAMEGSKHHHCNSSNHEFVIKRLRLSASSSNNKGAFHQLIGEATLLAQLDHPQIAKLRAFLSTPSSSKGNN